MSEPSASLKSRQGLESWSLSREDLSMVYDALDDYLCVLRDSHEIARCEVLRRIFARAEII